MATNSKSNELIFRSRFFRIHKNKSPALGGMSFFIVFVQRRQRRPRLGLSVRLRVRMVVVGLDIVAPLCPMMMIAAVAARMHPSTCSRCSDDDALLRPERLVPRLQSIVVAAVLHVFCVRVAVGLPPPASLDERDRPCHNAIVHRSEPVRYPRFAYVYSWLQHVTLE